MPEFLPDRAVILYRGHRLEQRLQGGCGTYRVLRPDGTWRYTLPTFIGGETSEEWVILAPQASGDFIEIDRAPTVTRARIRVDRVLAQNGVP